jgi:hypothetical protein
MMRFYLCTIIQVWCVLENRQGVVKINIASTRATRDVSVS